MATMSRGVYRIPYRAGTPVRITADHFTHSPDPTRYDMKGTSDGPHRIAAAADGEIRFIVDQFFENRPGLSPCKNNYVWIKHPTGEWTKYSHMAQRSVTQDAGLSVGDLVRAGQFLGIESDVGCSTGGQHLHFEVAVPIDETNPIDSEGRIIGGSARNRIAWFCHVPGHTLVDGNSYNVASCEPLLLEPRSIDFAAVILGRTDERPLAIANSSGAPVRVSFQASTSAPFIWPAFNRVIPNGERAEISVKFHPTKRPRVNKTLAINSNAPGGPHSVLLSGSGAGDL